MALHRLISLTMGVPNVSETAAYYTDFGLTPDGDGWFTTQDAGRQLRIVHAPTRRLVDIRIGADSPDDLASAASRLARLDVPAAGAGGGAYEEGGTRLVAYDRATGIRAVVDVAPRFVQEPRPAPVYNGPGRSERTGSRAPGVLRTTPVRPRKLGHAVVGTTDFDGTTAFFRDGLGFRVSDYVADHGAFLRCSTDHHNVLVMKAPVTFLHHTSWQVDDIDEVGRGASAMLEEHPERHVWGLGRHHAGSNFFWYLKDPAGNFSEYYSDMDCIVDEQLWSPEVLEGAKGLFNWGPPPPPSFLAPEDLAEIMTGNHSAAR
ncbi:MULTISPECIES: VOC family protein [unclassified Streptomyces]|uniref:VOC family protein n=1 Tax=unclassified Streptomyces TaxID=2593676 RepID=UPI0010110244|nr:MULTISPECIES: VOC family protein [unclassified Streptomyces]NJA59359.1 dioxygenase [Streptomyces sp. NEAU-H3]